MEQQGSRQACWSPQPPLEVQAVLAHPSRETSAVLEAAQDSPVSLATSAWVSGYPLHTHIQLIPPRPAPGAASPGDAQGGAVADHRVGVAGNNHCPHCWDCSLGRSQAAWAESPEEEGRTAGPRHSECLILGRRGGTSPSGMLHPATTSRALNLGCLQKPQGSAALPALIGSTCPSLGWLAIYKHKITQHPQVQSQHYDLSSSPVAGHFPSWQVVSVSLSPQMAQKQLKEAAALGCPGLSLFQPMLIVPDDWLLGEEVNTTNPSQHSDDW